MATSRPCASGCCGAAGSPPATERARPPSRCWPGRWCGAAGIYGVLAGSVTERRREIGVRAALGASRPEIVRMILREGAAMTAIGIALGLLAAAALSRVIAGLLFDTSRLDPATYGGVA